MFNIAVAQSGGPTCAINASLAGVIEEAKKHSEIDKVYGLKNGILGIIDDKLVDISDYIQDKNDLEILKSTPSTALGSCRFKLPEIHKDNALYEKIVESFVNYNIKAFFYIGGNDSMDTVLKLAAYIKKHRADIKVIGIPKTIDNDLPFTDHTPGFGSAAKFVATTISEIIRDSSVYWLDSVTIVEVMGRDAGWLTAASCVLRVNGIVAPHLIYLPEVSFNEDEFIKSIKEVQKNYKSVIVAVSEGMRYADGDYVGTHKTSQAVDPFGHTQLSGLGKYLEGFVKSKLKCKVRSIELNVLQRCSSHLASATDINEAALIGQDAVKAALNGKTGVMMVFKREDSENYKIFTDSVDVKLVANKEKKFPAEWINEQGNNIKDEAVKYFLPLIQGEREYKTKNGLPVHMIIENI